MIKLIGIITHNFILCDVLLGGHMKIKILFFTLSLFLLVSCQTNGKPESIEENKGEDSSYEYSEEHEIDQQSDIKLPILSSSSKDLPSIDYSRFYYDNFIYNSYDDSYYISLYGEELEASGHINDDSEYPYNPPDIDKFCKIHSQTGEVTKILDYRADNLAENDGFIYFIDLNKNTIERFKDGTIEEVFSFAEQYPNIPYYYFRFYIEENYLFLLYEKERVIIYELESMIKLENREYDNPENFDQSNTETKNQKLIYDLINEFYEKENLDYQPEILSLDCYDEVSLVHTAQELFVFDAEDGEITLVCNSPILNYTLYNNCVYYISWDTLYSYQIKSKETEMIISLLEYKDDPIDNPGCAQLREVVFINGHCFLYIEGMLTYSYPRIAELDLESKTLFYLTDYFEDKSNKITSFYGGPYSFEYPNDYSVFIDYGSGGGTFINNYKEKIRIRLNGMGMPPMNTEGAFKEKTENWDFLYYSYDEIEGSFSALLENDNDSIRIEVDGDIQDIKRNEENIIKILKSIYVYED